MAKHFIQSARDMLMQHLKWRAMRKWFQSESLFAEVMLCALGSVMKRQQNNWSLLVEGLVREGGEGHMGILWPWLFVSLWWEVAIDGTDSGHPIGCKPAIGPYRYCNNMACCVAMIQPHWSLELVGGWLEFVGGCFGRLLENMPHFCIDCTVQTSLHLT